MLVIFLAEGSSWSWLGYVFAALFIGFSIYVYDRRRHGGW
jgi:hypothetical protein